MTVPRVPSSQYYCRNLAGGEWRESLATQRYEIASPYTNQVISIVPESTKAETDAVVAAAAAAFPAWRAVPVKERCALLFKFREGVLARLDDLSHLAAAEAGKTVEEARGEILKGLEVTEFALSVQNLDQGGMMEVSRGVTCSVRREPLGVVAGITPFNFPAMVPFWMYPIALVAGNCFVLKPSEKVALSSQRIGEIITATGFPPGVFSIINGGRETAENLVAHPAVKAVGFVGSTPAAQAIYTRATALGKRALCLGGAKNHIIVVPDADEAVTVPGVVSSFTGCAGQRCMAASLLIAVGAVDHLVNKFAATARMLPLGPDMGAIIDRAALSRMESIIERAQQQGATLVLDGRAPRKPSAFPDGNWLGATIIDHAKPSWECATAEIFGPVLTIVRVNTLTEAMALEHASPYGNATSVFTTSGAIAKFVSDHATTGMIGVNIGVPVPREPFSFGGTKASKFGHGDMTGISGLDFWTDLKKVTTKWTLQTDQTWLS